MCRSLRTLAGRAPTFAHVAASGAAVRTSPEETPGRTRAKRAWRCRLASYAIRRRCRNARAAEWPVVGNSRRLSVFSRSSSSIVSRYSARVRQCSSWLRASRSSTRGRSLSICVSLSFVRCRSSSSRRRSARLAQASSTHRSVETGGREQIEIEYRDAASTDHESEHDRVVRVNADRKGEHLRPRTR